MLIGVKNFNFTLHVQMYTLIQLGLQYTQTCQNRSQDQIDGFNSIQSKEELSNFIQNNVLTIPCGVTDILRQFNYIKQTGVRKIVIPDSVTSLLVDGEKGGFEQLTSLKQIKIPNSITVIPKRTFYGCTQLQYVSLPRNLQTIENSAFENCFNLERIIIPEAVTQINEKAFANMTHLNCITILGEEINIQQNAFLNTKFENKSLDEIKQMCQQQNIYPCDEQSKYIIYENDNYCTDDCNEYIIKVDSKTYCIQECLDGYVWYQKNNDKICTLSCLLVNMPVIELTTRQCHYIDLIQYNYYTNISTENQVVYYYIEDSESCKEFQNINLYAIRKMIYQLEDTYQCTDCSNEDYKIYDDSVCKSKKSRRTLVLSITIPAVIIIIILVLICVDFVISKRRNNYISYKRGNWNEIRKRRVPIEKMIQIQ